MDGGVGNVLEEGMMKVFLRDAEEGYKDVWKLEKCFRCKLL